MMIADNTPSMSQNDTGCTLAAPNNTKDRMRIGGTSHPCSNACAVLADAHYLQLWIRSLVDEIGLDVFPQLANNSKNLATDTDCTASDHCGSGHAIRKLRELRRHLYQVIPFTADFRNSGHSGVKYRL